MGILKKLNNEGKTIIIVTHDNCKINKKYGIKIAMLLGVMPLDEKYRKTV